MATAILTGQGGKRYKTNQITGLTATVGWATANTVKLTWANPTDVNFKGLVIRYKAGSYPTGPTDGYSFYDSNDATPVATYTVTGANIVDGTTFYFRAFAYSYIGATRVYNSDTAGAQVTAVPYRNQGIQTFTASGTFTVPFGINSVDIFLVGGGGGGGSSSITTTGGGGGGGGLTKTQKNISVTPGQSIPVVVGSGSTATGGTSSCLGYSAAGGHPASETNNSLGGGSGGSGGGGGGYSYSGTFTNGGAGGTDGGPGGSGGGAGGSGQGLTTKAFDDTSGGVYAGGGGGGGSYPVSSGLSGARPGVGGASGGGLGGYWEYNNGNPYKVTGATGVANTGGGGGGSPIPLSGAGYGGSGGSGIVIIRWGY